MAELLQYACSAHLACPPPPKKNTLAYGHIRLLRVGHSCQLASPCRQGATPTCLLPNSIRVSALRKSSWYLFYLRLSSMNPVFPFTESFPSCYSLNKHVLSPGRSALSAHIAFRLLSYWILPNFGMFAHAWSRLHSLPVFDVVLAHVMTCDSASHRATCWCPLPIVALKCIS